MDHHQFLGTTSFFPSPHRSSFVHPQMMNPTIGKTRGERKGRYSQRCISSYLQTTTIMHTFQSPSPTRSRYSRYRSNHNDDLTYDIKEEEEREFIERKSKHRHRSMSQERRSQIHRSTEGAGYSTLRPGLHRYGPATPMSPIRPKKYERDLSKPRLLSPPKLPRRIHHSTINPFTSNAHHSHSQSTPNDTCDEHQILQHRHHHRHHQHHHQHHRHHQHQHQHQHQNHSKRSHHPLSPPLPPTDSVQRISPHRIQRRRDGSMNIPLTLTPLRNPKPPVYLHGHEIVGHPSLRVHRLRLPENLRVFLDAIVNGCEQYTESLPNGWYTNLYSLTKQDLALRDIPHIFELSKPIMSYLKKVTSLLYGYRSLRVDRNQPHVLKYSVGDDPSKNNGDGDHTGVELHHDKCDVTVNLMLSRGNTYRGGGTFFPKAEQTVRIEHGEFLIHPGSCVHGGADITGGTRYLMVIFANEKK